MAERQFGPYRLVRQIAVGGMAEIHLAKTKGIAGFEKYVALKMIHPNFAEDEQFIQMLVDEAKIAVQLNHGNIAQTFDLGRVGDTYYITMEYVDGADLYKILRRASEVDLELPLDVVAFVGREMASALDHAHRKKDHTGRSLGIVHRDVSPQNVLISYAGEVKLVDFGIAKATMKAKQTAVGVIKGKYYYMSPEQAWGDQIDFRSDIFSAGIVLYEMITGQMLYLEEDLHRLLDMVRKADIQPPSRLRRGVPPQLERIVMRALAKSPGDRYPNAADFASDLERFLHAYSPVFTAAKVAQLVKRILGDPQDAPEIEVERRDGPAGTLNPEELVHEKEEIRDENSVIFRMSELQGKPQGAPAGRVTRQAEIKDLEPPPRARPMSVPKVAPLPAPPRPASKPRLPNEETREVAPAPPRSDDSGLLDVKTPPVPQSWDGDSTLSGQDDLDTGGEHTMITGTPGGFLMDVASEEGVDATMIGGAPPEHDDDGAAVDPATDAGDGLDGATLLGVGSAADEPTVSSEDGPTIQREPSRPRTPAKGSRRAPAPPALAAKIQTPAVSELRKPRASRKTPAGGIGGGNVLHAIVGAQPSEPMPAPRPGRSEDSSATTLPQQPSPVAGRALAMGQGPMGQGTAPPQYGAQAPAPYATDASGLPLALSTPPPGTPVQMTPGVPPHLQPYAMHAQTPPQGAAVAAGFPPYAPQPAPGYPGAAMPPYAGYPAQTPPQGMHQVTPGALYAMNNPYGNVQPQPMSLTGQMRLYEVDELPSQYKVSGNAIRWIRLVIAGVLAVSVAGGVTYLIMTMRQSTPTVASIHVESNPPNAEVSYDDTKLAGKTPLTIDSVPVGTRHKIEVDYPRHAPYFEEVDVPKAGGEVTVTAALKPILGKLVINTVPGGADVYINGELRGHTPITLTDVDMDSAHKLEIKLKGYQDYAQNLDWPGNGEIDIDRTLAR